METQQGNEPKVVKVEPPTGTEIVPFKRQLETFGALLENMKPQLALALPSHIKADRLARIVLTTVQRVPALLECTQRSVLGSILQAAQLGLEPDGILGEAYLIPYNESYKDGNTWRKRKVCQLIPGYKGLMKLARNSGQISTLYARVVREKDTFRYSYGLKDVLKHVPSLDADPGKVTHVYAIAKLRDGGAQFEVMSVREVEVIRARSRAGTSGPWVTDWDEMAKKTAIRRLVKMLPASVELARAVVLDEQVDADLPQTFETALDVEATVIGQTGSDPTTDAPAQGESVHQKEAAPVKPVAPSESPAAGGGPAGENLHETSPPSTAASGGKPRQSTLADVAARGKKTAPAASKNVDDVIGGPTRLASVPPETDEEAANRRAAEPTPEEMAKISAKGDDADLPPWMQS